MNTKPTLSRTISLKTLISVAAVAILLSTLVTYQLVYSNSISPAVYLDDLPSQATYTIKTDGTTIWATRYDGDIEFQGTNVTAIITNTIEQLTSGGKIFIRKGTYTITSGDRILIWQKNNIWIYGEGSSTVITQSNGVNVVHFFQFYASNYSGICDLRIDGNKALQTSGTSAVGINGGSYGVTVKNLIIHNMKDQGVEITQSAGANWIINNYITDCDNCAVTVKYASETSGRNFILQNHIQDIDAFGIGLIYANDNIISGNEITQDPTDTFNEGINLDSSSYNIISSNIILTTGDVGISLHNLTGGLTWFNEVSNNEIKQCDMPGIHLVGSGVCYNTINENVIVNCNQNGVSNGNGSAILIQGGIRNTISNNQVIDTQGAPTHTWGIYEDLADYSIIISTNCLGATTGGIHIEGANSHVSQCWNTTTWVDTYP